MGKEQKSPSNGKERCEKYDAEKVEHLSRAFCMGFDLNASMTQACSCELTDVTHRVFLHMVAECGVDSEKYPEPTREAVHAVLKEHFEAISLLADVAFNKNTGVKMQ